MVFNFIRKYPYIDEKLLLSKSMLAAVDLRKCLAQLIAQGFVNFYQENSRTMLYACIKPDRLKEKFVGHLCETMLNLFVYLDQVGEKD